MLIKVNQFLQQPNTKLKHLSEQGFTLVESLMAMVVISIVIVAITPPIFLSVANRVQHRRTEQAIQLAQGEMDRVRVLVEQGDYKLDDLPAEAPTPPSGSYTDKTFEEVDPPTNPPGNNLKSDRSDCSSSSPPSPPYTVSQLPFQQAWRVDIDRDCKMDFLVQIFRDKGNLSPTVTLMAFRMGVRVYAAMAAENVANLVDPPLPASLKFTSGFGNQRSRPLAVVYNKIARSDTPSSLSQYDKSLLP